jgi:hypothetical protein
MKAEADMLKAVRLGILQSLGIRRSLATPRWVAVPRPILGMPLSTVTA